MTRISDARPRIGRLRRQLRRIAVPAGVVAGVLLVTVLFSAWRMARVANQLTTARDAAERAESAVRAGELGVADDELERAERAILRANNALQNSAELSAVGWLPVARQNIASLRSSVRVLLTLVNGGRTVLAAGAPLADAEGRLRVPLQAGAIPLDAVTATQRALDGVASSLPSADDLERSSLVFGPVARLHREVYREASVRREQFATVGAGLELISDLAGSAGPRRYLIAVGNTAEMRGTGGMILSYGVLRSAGGAFTLDRFGPIDELLLPEPAPLPNPPDYVKRFSSLEPAFRWRNTNLSADFTAVAPVMEKMFAAAAGVEADGVIQIDPQGLAAILRGVGPISVPDIGTVTADNVVALTLNEAYTRFPDRAVRRDYLETVAEAAFQRLVSGSYPDLRPLARALAEATAGRHVMLHSTSRGAQRAVTRLGGDGSLPPDGTDFAHVTVQNFSGNKLDYYVDTSVSITGARLAGRPSRLRIEIDTTNSAPAGGAPPYVFGPISQDLRQGEYRGFVTLYLPQGSSLAAHSGDSTTAPVSAAESHRTTISYTVELLPGETSVVALDVLVPSRPPGPYAWWLVPSPRVRPTVASVDLDLGDRRVAVTGPLLQTIVARPAR